jgi:hypothetical protein
VSTSLLTPQGHNRRVSMAIRDEDILGGRSLLRCGMLKAFFIFGILWWSYGRSLLRCSIIRAYGRSYGRHPMVLWSYICVLWFYIHGPMVGIL